MMKKIFRNTMLSRKGLAVLLSMVMATGVMADEQSVLLVHLKDGSKLQFVLPVQKPEVKFSNGMMEVNYDRLNADGVANVTFYRDEVERLEVGNAQTTVIDATQAEKPRIQFDLSRTAVLHVSGMQKDDRLQVFSLDGKRIEADIHIKGSEATVDLTKHPRGVYMVSVNQRFTFKLLKP